MIRWLLIALFIFLIIRIIRGPKKRRKPFIRFHFGNMGNQKPQNGRQNRNKPRLDDIEEAEYEDITEKIKKENDQ